MYSHMSALLHIYNIRRTPLPTHISVSVNIGSLHHPGLLLSQDMVIFWWRAHLADTHTPPLECGNGKKKTEAVARSDISPW